MRQARKKWKLWSLALITDYLDRGALRGLEESFSVAAGAPTRICDPEGSPLPGDEAESAVGDAPGEAVSVNGEVVGRVCVCGPAAEIAGGQQAEPLRPACRQGRLARLMAEMLGRLCEGERQLRARAGELGTLFGLTAEFSGQRELQSLLDLVARTVVGALNAKACSIRLLDEDSTELLIQSAVNFSSEYLDKGPILLSASEIDREVLETRQPVYIADQRTDPRVLYPREARKEGIVSALCAPLVHQGRAEGVIRVYTDQPHEFDWFEVSLLEAIAAQASAAIVNARLHAQASGARNLRRHLRTAAVVQRRMTPSEAPEVPGMELAAVYVPCFELAGDFYDFIPLPGDNLGVAICDVVGKGVRASLLMASIRASLRAHAQGVYDIGTVLERVNRDLCAASLEGDFATLFYGVIDARSRRFTYSNAGHPPPLLFRGGQIRRLETCGPVIGLAPDRRWVHEHFALAPGDAVLAYTDGLSEALNFEDEAFGAARIEAAARAGIGQGFGAEALARHVLWEMRRFAGLQTRFDDLTLVAATVQ